MLTIGFSQLQEEKHGIHTFIYIHYSFQNSIHNSTRCVPEGAHHSTHEIIC